MSQTLKVNASLCLLCRSEHLPRSSKLRRPTGVMLAFKTPSGSCDQTWVCACQGGQAAWLWGLTRCMLLLQDMRLAQDMQSLFASQAMRVNTTTDVVGVEICGALKNVLAIAAGIVEGLQLGHNAMAALISQVQLLDP